MRITRSWISNGTEGSCPRSERCDGDTPFAEGDPTPFPVVAGYQKVGGVERVGAEVDGLEIVEAGFAAARSKVVIEKVVQRTRRTVAIFDMLREHATFGLEHWWGDSVLRGHGEHSSRAADRAPQLTLTGRLDLPARVPYVAAQPLSRRRRAAAA